MRLTLGGLARTRMLTMRSPSKTYEAVWPSSAVFTAAAMSWTLKPNRAASAGRTRKLIGGAGFRQAVERVHDAGDFFDFLLHARGGLLQPFQIGREQFDFDRIGRQL